MLHIGLAKITSANLTIDFEVFPRKTQRFNFYIELVDAGLDSLQAGLHLRALRSLLWLQSFLVGEKITSCARLETKLNVFRSLRQIAPIELLHFSFDQ